VVFAAVGTPTRSYASAAVGEAPAVPPSARASPVQW
jgi:hypothetical protein